MAMDPVRYEPATPGPARPEPIPLRESVPREAVVGLIVLAVFLLVFAAWGLLARLDAAVAAPGQVVVAGSRRAVQHRDGGIVSELDVHEGDPVRTGQVLLKLNADELVASERATAAQVIGGQAMQARLMAELTGAPEVTVPPELARLRGEDGVTAQAAMKLQRLEFARRGQALSTSQRVLKSQIAQAGDQTVGYDRQLAANRRQQGLLDEEIRGLQPLLERGLTPLTRLRSLQRNEAELKGSEGAYTADTARIQQEIGEKRIRIENLSSERDADDARELRTVQTELGELSPKLVALRQQIGRTEVRAPATGRVVGVTIFTVGGVVAAGQKLMDVVPDAEPLVIDARVKPSDMDELHVGQTTEIKITAFHDRSLPILHGRISRISADSFTDEKTNVAYFRIEATVPASEVKLIQRVRGPESGLKPGLPVEVIVPLSRRTPVDYLLGPIQDMLSNSFRNR